MTVPALPRYTSLMLFACSTLQILPATAQEQLPTLTRIPTEQARIRLDGILDEPAWDNVPVIDGMRVIDPDTLEPAPVETHTKIFYNSRGLYVGVMNYQDPATLVARMSSRDVGVQRDGYVLSIDPSGEGLYGYMMRINLGGTLSDGT
ncbi:MAG: hypothetical protein WBJ75_05240, partial [Pseudohongiellaceae bacterium]